MSAPEGIDRTRLEHAIEELGRIGETPRGGLTRLALTDEDKRGRDLMVRWMREAGLRVSVDQMGNIFGERAGSEPLPPVMMGSHVDSVPTGGKYDGQLGVLCGLETIRALNTHRIRTRHPVTLAIFTNEEGARFQPAMIASGVTTVGNLVVHPNIVNAIPGKVTMSIDLRDPRDATLEVARRCLDAVVKAACDREGVRGELEHYWRVPYTPFAPDVVAAIERAAKGAGARFRHLLSGAGHDAQYMAAIGPAGMIFVPSRGGRSHCEEEFTPMDDIEHGATTLFLAVVDLAGRG